MTALLTKEHPTELNPTSSLQDLDIIVGNGKKRIPLYAAVLCRIGIHQGKWVYLTISNCHQLKVCRYCRVTLGRIKHQREWQYVRKGACEQERVCRQCSEINGRRIKHDWGPVYSVSWGRDAHKCARCGEVQTWAATG